MQFVAKRRDSCIHHVCKLWERSTRDLTSPQSAVKNHFPCLSCGIHVLSSSLSLPCRLAHSPHLVTCESRSRTFFNQTLITYFPNPVQHRQHQSRSCATTMTTPMWLCGAHYRSFVNPDAVPQRPHDPNYSPTFPVSVFASSRITSEAARG